MKASKATAKSINNGTSVEITALEKDTAGRVRYSNPAQKPVRRSAIAVPAAYKAKLVAACISGDPARAHHSPSPHTEVVAAITQAIIGGLVK